MSYKDWNIEAMTGYHPKTTFYVDFSLAEYFGLDAIQNTYDRVLESWKDNCEYLTEFVMVLNWKIWEHYETNEELARLYDRLWKEADEYAMTNLTGDELKYYLETTD